MQKCARTSTIPVMGTVLLFVAMDTVFLISSCILFYLLHHGYCFTYFTTFVGYFFLLCADHGEGNLVRWYLTFSFFHFVITAPPQDLSDCPGGYTKYNDHICYKLYIDDLSVHKAMEQCEKDGAQLASIASRYD